MWIKHFWGQEVYKIIVSYLNIRSLTHEVLVSRHSPNSFSSSSSDTWMKQIGNYLRKKWGHLLLELHICMSESGQYWFRWWLVTYSVPSHYLHQFWFIVNWELGNKFQLNFNPNSYIFIQENAFENVICKIVAIWSRWRWIKHTHASHSPTHPKPNKLEKGEGQVLDESGHLLCQNCVLAWEYVWPVLWDSEKWKYSTLHLPVPYKHTVPDFVVTAAADVWAHNIARSSAGTQGAVSIRKTVLPGMAIPMLKIRRPNGRLIFNMEIATRR